MTGLPLEPAPADAAHLLEAATAYVLEVLAGLETAPASAVEATAAVAADPELRAAPAADGRDLKALLGLVDRAASAGFNPASGGYLAFIPGGGLLAAAAADLIGDVLNRYTGVAYPAPGLVAIETGVLDWMAQLFGLPSGSGGLLTTGGSLAALSALVAARTDRLPPDFLRGTIYVSTHTHASVAKAARIAGFPEPSVRTVPVDPDLRMDVEALRTMVAADRAAGAVPFCVVANAGSTDTGTVDPLADIGRAAQDDGLWYHVDAAYGGFFQLTDRGRAALRGIESADSIVLDPHKGLFLPFGTGALLVRDAEKLRRAHSGDESHYLQDIADIGLPSFADYGPELTRDARGLRVWLPLHLHGVDAFRAALDERLDLAAEAYDALRTDASLVVPWRPDLSVVAFRCAGDDPVAANAATAEVVRRVNAEQRVLLSSTQIGEHYFGRICVLHHRTDRERVRYAVAAVRRHAAAVVGTE